MPGGFLRCEGGRRRVSPPPDKTGGAGGSAPLLFPAIPEGQAQAVEDHESAAAQHHEGRRHEDAPVAETGMDHGAAQQGPQHAAGIEGEHHHIGVDGARGIGGAVVDGGRQQGIEQAQAQAQTIVDNAVADANNVRQGSIQYTDDMLKSLQTIMNHTMEGAQGRFDAFMNSMKSSYDIVSSNRKELSSGIITEKEEDATPETEDKNA